MFVSLKLVSLSITSKLEVMKYDIDISSWLFLQPAASCKAELISYSKAGWVFFFHMPDKNPKHSKANSAACWDSDTEKKF